MTHEAHVVQGARRSATAVR